MAGTSVPKVAVAREALDDIDKLRRRFEGSVEFVVGPVATADEVRELTRGADALVVTLQPLRETHIAALSSSVKVIARMGVGLDTIDIDAARGCGISVVYQPNYATNEVADQAVSMALACWRGLPVADRLIREQGWATSAEIGDVHALRESTAGVLGCGRIGRAVIDRLRPFVGRIIAFDAYPDTSIADIQWAADASSLLERSDLVTVHLPLLPETRNIVDAAAIERMKDGAVLVNVSRGGLIEEQSLADALHRGKLRAAGLDVFAHEPLPQDSPLRQAPNLLLSPHVAWYSLESGERLATWSIEDVLSHLSGEGPRHGSFA